MDALRAVVKDAAGDPAFLLGAIVAVAAAVLMVTRRNPVYAALWLMLCFLAVAVIFLKLHAAFLAAIHVLVYTGAILVLFLFVIMLLNLTAKEMGEEHSGPSKLLAAGVCGALFLLLAVALLKGAPDAGPFRDLETVQVDVGKEKLEIPADDWGGVRHVGSELFRKPFVVSFEIVSVLIVTAILGAVVLAKRSPSP
jgi:NADH-quinone oxidoreductase subunit J